MSATTCNTTPAGQSKRSQRRAKVGGRSKNENFSRKMTYLLRHGAVKEGLAIDEKGFIAVPEMLAYGPIAKMRMREADVRDVVANCPKQRFFLEERPEGLFIRANQGHSLQNVAVDMHPIKDASEVPVAVHGTYYGPWNKIKVSGLSKMARQHIHIATGVPGADNVISGMRSTAQVLIYIDVERVLQDQIPMLLSANNVVLTAGVNGYLAPRYFLKVVDVASGDVIFTNR
eukprot:CAMPEP_0114628026 /NCGR_PEP_ID=MMETSP0168-20121206/12603_1 /TAXON_ID=95228 ORGANISM="Vannella sp., Strain DIVA3 517/6/12" /NCGR_SAMPLE_ID=MMETSP0168 /ASSEMBLY_ACC=CAM_ASM_000044 /LENGTH=229 /DNA_ID=CAMNT_0001839385 /DNA_START=44 /DNA_END=730 /DNA_ORIENTATION=-